MRVNAAKLVELEGLDPISTDWWHVQCTSFSLNKCTGKPYRWRLALGSREACSTFVASVLSGEALDAFGVPLRDVCTCEVVIGR